MELEKINTLKSSLSLISKGRTEIFKKLSNLFKTYRPPMSQEGWNALMKERDKIWVELQQNNEKYKEELLNILKQIREESDEIIQQYCDSIINNFDSLNINHDNGEQFINDVNEIIEMYYEEVRKFRDCK